MGSPRKLLSSVRLVSGSATSCFGRPEVQAYLGQVETRTLKRWVLPPSVNTDQKITLRFRLDVFQGRRHPTPVEAAAERGAVPLHGLLVAVEELTGGLDVGGVFVRGNVRIEHVGHATHLFLVVDDEAPDLAFRVVGVESERLEGRPAGPQGRVEGFANDVEGARRPEFVDVVSVDGATWCWWSLSEVQHFAQQAIAPGPPSPERLARTETTGQWARPPRD